MLTSAAREVLRDVEYVIVDEVHAIAGSKRGAHLALSLERLEALRARRRRRRRTNGPTGPPTAPDVTSGSGCPPRNGRSRRSRGFLGGIGPGPRGRHRRRRRAQAARAPGRRAGRRHGGASASSCRPRTSPAARPREATSGRASGRRSTRAILELIRSHRSTIVFTNSRRLSERLAQRLNELAGEELVRAHHGSIAREQRLQIEEELKAGRLPALVATSSLELGIDMGAVDLVIQVESPTSVARGLQRIGRAGHQVGAPEQGRDLPEVPRRPARMRGRHPPDARGRDRDDRRSRATRSTSWPSSSSR